MATHGDIGLSQPAGSTITFKLDAISLDHNSTTVLREVMVVGSPETTNALTAVLNAAPASTAWGMVVRGAGAFTVDQGSTAFSVQVSTGAVSVSTGSVTVHQGSTNFSVQVSTGAVSVSTGSVTVHGNVSSNSSAYLPVRLTNGTAFITAGTDYADGSTASGIAGPTLTFDNGSNATMRAVSLTNGFPVNVVAGAAGGSTLVTIRQSTVGDLRAAVYQSTASDLQATVRVNTSSGGAVEGSTTTPAQGVIGLNVRQVYPTLNSTTIVVTSTHSTAIYSLISSVASLRHKVYAYFVGSTHTVGSTLIFCSSASGSGFDHWHVNFGSGSSGVTGANMAVNPPGFIFAGVSQNALNVKIEGGSSATSTVVARISISWFDEA